jgi:hypothetical protein
MTSIMLRRFAILCLSFALFAVGFWLIVDSHQRPTHIGQFELGAPCPQPQGILCKTRI